LTLVAELAWRWSYGAALLLTAAFAITEYLKSLPVDRFDQMALSGILPPLVVPAIKHIFAGSGPALVRTLFVTVFALALLWWPAATAGRIAILSTFATRARFRTMAALEALRLLVRLSYALAVLGAAAASWLLTRNIAETGVNGFWMVFLPLTLAASILAAIAQRYTRVAQVVSAVRGIGCADSIAQSFTLISREPAQFTWTGIIFAIARLALWAYGFGGAFFILGIVAQAPGAVLLAIFLLYLMVYSVARNAIELARTAALVRIVQWSDRPPVHPAFSDMSASPPQLLLAPTRGI